MKSPRITFFTIFLTLVVGAMNVYAQPGGKAIRTTMKALDSTFGDYYWVAYPTEIWGVGSIMNDDDSKGTDPFKSPSRQIMPGWRFFGLPRKPATPEEMITPVSNYIYINDGPAISAANKLVSDTSLSATLPLISNLLGVSGNFSSSKHVEIKMLFAKLKIRSLDKPLAKEYIDQAVSKVATNPANASPYEKEIARLMKAKRLFVVTDDILIYGMEIEAKIKTDTDAGVQAQLKGDLEKHVGKDANASFKVVRKMDGAYSITINEPFVFARHGRNRLAWK